MATVVRENIGKLHDKVIVKLTKEDYLPAFEKALKQYAKNASIPGFRKGMVPAGMIRKMAGQSLLSEEVVRTASRELEEYLKGENLSIFAQPMLSSENKAEKPELAQPKDIDFIFEIGIKPDFEIPAIRDKAPLTAYKIVVSDKMVDDETDRIRKRFGNVIDQEKIIGTDDVVYINLQKCDADGNVTGSDKLEETTLLANLPVQLQTQLMDKIPGSVVVFRPADVCTEEELPRFLKAPLKTTEEDAEQNYLLTLTKVGLLMPADLGIELYEKVFPSTIITSEEDFRNLLKQEVQREYDRIGRERYHNEIFEMLVHTTPIELPVNFLKRWMMEGGETPKTAEEVENEFGGFEHQLRWQLISDKVIQDNRIAVKRDEVKNDIKARVFSYYGMSAEDEAPWMDSYMEKVMKDDKMADETFRRLLTEKIFANLENQFSTTMQEVDEETFFKLPNPHAAYHHHHD